MVDTGTGLPPLPEPLEPGRLRELDADRLEVEAAGLGDLERATIAAMAPFDRRLREIRARQAEIGTERRRRERAERTAARLAVREQAKSGALPSLAEALEQRPSPLPEERGLNQVRAYLGTGGEVSFGYPARPGVLAFSDGRQVRNATTWGQARQLFDEGWEPGTPGVAGVRVHLVGTRQERVITADDLVLDVNA